MAPEDTFWIASMSKPMTTTAFMMLVDEGKVSLDDPVSKFIPSFAKIMVRPPKGSSGPATKPDHPVTIREILSHNSGLTFSAPEESPTLDTYPLSERVEFYVKNMLAAQPGTQFIYANAGINTIGRIIEIISGIPYEQFMQKRIFDPLGMTHTTFYPTGQQVACLPVSYKQNATKDGLIVVPIAQLSQPFDDRTKRYPVPAGGLFSTVADATIFAQMLANDGVYKGKRYISKESLHAAIIKETSSKTKTAYGLGFSIINRKIGHNGAYKTDMWVLPDSGLITIFFVQQSGNWPKDGNERVGPAFDKAVATFDKDAKPLTGDPVWQNLPPK
jgi:CubicO group peptidase (beta-lactamase class C family)